VQDVMNVLGLVYSQYWLKSMCEETFLIHLAIFKGVYYQFKKLGSNQTWIPIIIDDHILELQCFFIKNHHAIQCLVGYGPAHGFESLVQALGKVLQQWLVIYLCWRVHESDKIGRNLDYGICGR
jgi:hypothetical protein